MHPGDPSIDELLASALRREEVPWPGAWNEPAAIDAAGRAAIVHGIAGLLVRDLGNLRGWPAALVASLRDQARAQAMWELRHRQLLVALFEALDAEAISCLVMKGTAVAYDLYDEPSTRSRGDTDLLVAKEDAANAQAILARLGYAGEALGGVTPEFALQQTWTLNLPDGGSHSVDLHWQVMNAPTLANLLAVSDCFANARPLPRLSPLARTMDRVRLLIHTCLHRAMQSNAPYFVDGRAYYEPDRLIWSHDVHLLATALGEDEWSLFSSLAEAMGVSGPCLDGLRAARANLGTEIPDAIAGLLERSSAHGRPNPYFTRSHALSRAWQDLRSIRGAAAKLRYIRSRVVTTEPFILAKYSDMAGRPLPLLYGRRLLDLARGKVRRAAP